MLMPKRVKHRKQHRGKNRGKAQSGAVISFGDYGLQAMEHCWLKANQIEAARIAMTRHIKRGGQIWIRVFPDKPYTKKPAETRMGSGKGAPEGWVAVIKPGRMLFEMKGPSEELAREAMRLAAHKLPIDVRFVIRASKDASGANSADAEMPDSIDPDAPVEVILVAEPSDDDATMEASAGDDTQTVDDVSDSTGNASAVVEVETEDSENGG